MATHGHYFHCFRMLSKLNSSTLQIENKTKKKVMSKVTIFTNVRVHDGLGGVSRSRLFHATTTQRLGL